MATDAARYGTRKQQVLLGVLVTVLVIVVAFVWSGGWNRPAPTGAPRAASGTQPRRQQGTRTSGSPEDLNVKLDALQAEHPGPGEIERNPFRFEARRQAEAPAADEPDASRPAAPAPETPSGPPPPPPIPLKFIGIIESPQAGRVAALSDGRRVFQGREGTIIEGRYRIVRIGVESIVMEYADGSGTPQTIRLSGQ